MGLKVRKKLLSYRIGTMGIFTATLAESHSRDEMLILHKSMGKVNQRISKQQCEYRQECVRV